MKKIIILGILVLMSLVFAVNVIAPGATCNAGLNSYSCGQTIPESCTLVGNTTATGNCFTIGANNVVIDCAGYSITGPGVGYTANGINISKFNSTTIKNCIIKQFTNDIFINISYNNTIINNTLTNATFNGLQAINMYNSSLTNNTVRDTINTGGIAFFFDNSSYNTFENNIANTNVAGGLGFASRASSYNTFINNTANNELAGIGLAPNTGNNVGSSYNQIINNTFNNNSIGIGLYGLASYNKVLNNKISNSTKSNIFISWSKTGILLVVNSRYNNISNNTISDSTTADIYMDSGSSSNNFLTNTISPYPTTFSFTGYSGAVTIKGVTSPQADPSGKRNISKYLTISGPTWLYLNLSYSDPDASGIDESTLKIYRYSGGWSAVSGSTVDTVNNIISANLTAFSDFGGFGDLPSGPVPEFSDYAMILIIVTAICGFYFVKRKK